MSTKRKLLFGLVMVTIFGLGMLTGVGLASRVAPAAVEKRAWLVHGRERWKRMSEELNLTQEQRQTIKPLVLESFRQQRKHLGEIRRELNQLDDRINQELTDEQRVKFREMRKHDRNHIRQLFNAPPPRPGREPRETKPQNDPQPKGGN
ncbi:MAG: hypothetical protein SFV32_11985 [Opitutaceae bacterium]|nr:hypothetical protein [Opitutaceae bacterium]